MCVRIIIIMMVMKLTKVFLLLLLLLLIDEYLRNEKVRYYQKQKHDIVNLGQIHSNSYT